MFIHLRLHTAFSLAEGAIRIPQAIELCQNMEMPALAMTDSNNLFGALEFATNLAKNGIQPLIGCSLNLDLTAEFEDSRGAKQNKRLETTAKPIALISMSEEGYLNLSRLSSIAFLSPAQPDSFCISLDTLEKYSAGLIALTGGRDGAVDFLIRNHLTLSAENLTLKLKSIFGDRLYVELQRHLDGVSEQTEPHLLEFAKKFQLPIVATNEPYFADTSIYEAHDALLCIADGAYVIEQNRRKVTPEHYFKSPKEMGLLFSDLPEAIEQTIEIARRCCFMPETRDPILPNFVEDSDEATELKREAYEGLKRRFAENDLYADEEEYWKRLDFELDVINTMKFPGYFLIVADFIKWSKTHDIPVGPGRGSGAGSLVAWALTITDLDPLRFNLLFERFLNPERISMPDFDIDFCQDRRDEVINYVQEKYGHDKVAQIITFGKLQARAVVRDVGRVMGLPYGQVDRISKLIPNNPANPVTLKEALETTPELKANMDSEEAVQRLITIALKLEGLYRHASTHAAGLVIGDRQLEELVPLYRDPKSTMPVTQFNLNWVEPAGLVKFDFLGLKTLTVLRQACKLLKRDGIDLDIDHIPLDDAKTYEMLAKGDSIGVFQFESAGMRDLLRQAQPSVFEDLIALVALFRPGPMENIPKYLACKHGEEEPEHLHDIVSPYVEETYGVIIYQEQVMQIAQTLSGYSLGEADILRRAMGKKKKEEMDKQKDRFLEGAVKNGVDRGQADYIFELVAKFAGYGFNKSHSACYAYIAYQTAYLKANYPVYFYAASMSLETLNTDKLYLFYADALRHDIEVVAPNINVSQADFSTQDNKVVYALSALKHVGPAAMEQLVRERERAGEFKDIYDFVERVDPAIANKRHVEQLAKAGAFDCVHANRGQICESSDQLAQLSVQADSERKSAQSNLFGEDVHRERRADLKSQLEWLPKERLNFEKETIGFYLSGHPLDQYQDLLKEKKVVRIADLRTQEDYTTRIVKLAGTIHSFRERRSRQSDRPYAFIGLSDPSGDFEVTAFSDTLAKDRDKLEVGSSIVMICGAEWENDDLRLTLKSVQTLQDNETRHIEGLKIYLNDPVALSSIKKILVESEKNQMQDQAKVVGDKPPAIENRPPGEKPSAISLVPEQLGRINLILQSAISEAPEAGLVNEVAPQNSSSINGSCKGEKVGEIELCLEKKYPVSLAVQGAIKATKGVVEVQTLKG